MGGSAPEEGPRAGPVEPRDCGHGRQRRLGACTACRAAAAGVVVEQQGQKLGLTTQQALSAKLRVTRAVHAALDDEDARYRREEIESKGFRRDLVKATSVAEAAVLLEGHRQSQHNRKRVGLETGADTSSSTQSINEAAYKETEILDDTSFQDLSEFRTWLHESGIDTLHWGLARTKSSASLFREIQNKTSVLVIEAADGDSFRIFRLLRVVRARVKQEIERGRIRYLVEASQELGETGQLRYRNMLLSSMMRYGENAFNAARRSVEKEMQNINTVRGRCIPRRAITAKRDSPRVCVEDLESPSYPGLLTRYILVTVDVALDRRLPDADFCTVEYLPTMHIATKHYWKWRTRAEVAQIVNGKTSRSAPSTAHRRNLLLGDATESTSALLPGTEKPFFWSLYDDDFEEASDSDDLYIPFSRLRRHMRQWGLTENEISDLLQQIEDVLRDESLLSKSDFKEKLADPITELIVADQDSLSSRGLGNEHYQVLKNLFPNASRIFSRILHGGFSGSFVLQAQARYCDGSQGDPTVVKLDRRDLMRDEIQRFRALAPYMGDCAPAILQTDVEGSNSLLGGIKFELVGAVWMLPDFRSNLLNSGAAQPLSTFKKLFMHESAEEERARVEHALDKARVSSSHVLASHTSDKFLTMQTETQVARSPSSPASIASPMTGPMSPTSEDEEPRSALDARSPKEVSKGTNLVYGEVYQVLKEVFGEIMRTTTLSSKETISCSLLDVYKIDKYIGRLLEPPAVPDLTGAGAAGLPDWAQLDPTGSGRALLQRLLDKIDRQTYPYEMGLVHGDLNGMNILIDSHNIVWVIDFAFSGRGHVLTDIAKLESCVLFEYTQPRSNAEYEALQEVADILIQVGDLREVVFNSRFDMQTDAAPTDQLARVAFAWKAIKRLRMYAANYCDTDPGPAQMLVAMLHNAARALRFTDIKDKRLPFFVATSCAQRLLDFMETNRGSIKIPARAHSEAASRHKPMNASLSANQIRYEKHRYFHDVRVRESYILDLFTREPVNILEQTVELQMIEGSSREKVMREVANMDEIQAQRRLRKRLDALRGDILGCTADEGLGGSWPASAVNDEDNGHARFTSALQVLGNPRDEGHRVLLGGAASGKSCLMRKILVSMGHDLASDGHDVIPILILIIELGRLMTERKLTSEDDLLDAYFVSTFGEGSARLAFFRQMRKEDALCYLFDGLDEAGDHKPAIERYLAGLVDHERRIIISSRETGFNETAFRSFQFLQVMPLTDQMQSQIVEMRLGSDHPRLLTIRSELRKPQYAEIARNPLMLSLLVSLLANKANSASQSANGERPRSNQGILTRSYLYERAVAQLLHHGSMAKFGMRRGADDKHVQRSIETLASKISYGFLKSLAFTAQSLRTRDFGPDVLNRVAETYVADPVYFSSEVMAKPLALQEEVFRVIEVLQGAVYSGLCGLFATSRVSVQPNAAAEGSGLTTSQSSPQQVLRFVHLSFQEYLAGLFIVDHLQQALRSTKDGGEKPFCETIKSLLCICPEQETWGHLHDPWWQVTLASMAGSMPPRAFLAFAKCILSWDDSSGSNVLLCAELHAEAAASESLEGARDVGAEAPRSQVEALIKSRFSDYINEEELVDALTHPSRNLQLMALAEVHKLYDSRKAAYSIMFGPGIDETTDRAPLLLLPWYRRASAAYALSHLASVKNDEVIIDVLLGLWSDESGQVRRAAVEAIAALQAESHKLVIDELHRQLHDEVESENGHELVAALRVQHPRIIEDLLTIASVDESGASSSISSNSHEALLSLPLTVELLYTLCRAVSHAKILSVRSCAARILISRCAPEAGDEAAPLNETLETAFISWLEHPEVTFCMSAAQMLAQSTFKSFRIAQALTTLQKRVASLPGDHSDLWDAALVALVAVAQPADDLVHDALLFGLHAKASTTRGECIQLLQQLLPQILTQSQDFDESQEKRSLATSEPIEELSSAQASQEDRQAKNSRVPRKNASGGPSRVKQTVRLARYAERLRDMAQEDPDANVARQAYEVGQIIPQFGSEIAHSLFADDRAPPKVRSAALKSILQRAPNQAAIAQMLPILSEWIANGPRGLVDAAMRAMVSLKEGGPLHSALAKGTLLSWQQACKLVETLEQNAHSVKRLLDQHQMDIVLESLVKAYTAQKQEQTAAQDMGDIAEFAFCDALSGLGDSGFAFSVSESWLDCFADSDVNLQVALATMLSDACVCSLEETILGYIMNAETDKRVRASLALALHRLNRWKSESLQSAMEAWLLEEDESMQLAAIDVLCEIGDIGSRLVRLLPSLLHGASFRIGPAVQKARAQRAGLLTRKDTKARMRMAVLSHLRMHSDTNSLADTVEGKVALRESIAHGVQTLMLHPKFELAETDVLRWLDDAENVKLVTCEMLAKSTCTEAARTKSVAEKLFEILSAIPDGLNNESKTRDTAQADVSRVLCNAAKVALVTRFRRFLPWTAASERRLATGSAQVREALLKTLVLRDWVQDPALFNAMFPTLRSSCLNDDEREVRISAVALCTDWLRAVKDTRMEPALAEAQADNVARMEGCIEDVLLSFDREPSELSAVVDLMRGSTMSKAIFMAMIKLVRECPDQNVSARCRLALSQVKSPPPFQASDLLKLDTSGHESKLLWLTLLRKFRRNPAFTEIISDAEVVIYLRSFVAPETARAYSPSTALLVIEVLHCCTDLRITLESVDILNYLDVAATAYAEASDERILRILLQYLLVSENVRLDAAVVGHIIDLAGSESTDVTLETDRSRNIIHFFAQYQIKDAAETSSLLEVMEEHEVAASFLFEPVLSFLRRERTHRSSDEVHKSQAALRAQIDQLARTKRTLEATYLSKEIRFGFEMHDTLGVTSKQLALKGRGKIKEQRVQRQALKDMREAEWEQARAEWFPPTLVDQHLEFINVPASLEYQQSRLSTASTGVFLNAIPDEMATERQIFAQNVLPEIRRRLRAMGVPVALHLSNPEALGMFLEPISSLTSSSTSNFSSASGANFAAANLVRIAQRTNLARECAPFMVCFLGARYGQPQHKAQIDDSIEMLERGACFLGRPNMPTSALCYFRDATFYQDLAAHLEMESIFQQATPRRSTKGDAREKGNASSNYNAIELSFSDSEKPALANLEKVYAGEDSTDIRLKSRQEREKQAILSHPYVKSTNVRLAAPVKLQNSGHVSPNCLLDFFAQVTEDLLARILGEFPVRTSHRAKHTAGAVCGSEELAEELPFRLTEEQRAHEHYLWEHSQLLRSDTEFGGFLPRTRQHIYQDLQHLLTEDGSSDNKLRAERRTVKNPKFWTKDEHLGNSAILLTAERYQGKTTVLATFTDWYRSTCAPSLPPIIFHSCRASAMSGDLTLILLRLGVELLNVFHPRLDLEDWSPPCGCALNLESVRTWWHGLLCEVSSLALSDHRRPVLIIDGLFEVMDSASVESKEIWMGLLPQRYGGRCPPGVSMILSASACSNAKALARTNKRQHFPYRELQVGSLSKDEQTILLTEALARYRMRPTENLLLRTSRAGANFAPANLDIFARHVAGLHEGCTQVETSIEHLLGLLGNDELENNREEGGGNAPDGNAIVADRDRAHTILDSILIRLEVEFGVSLCRSILTCLALTGHMDESDLFEFSSQFSETISPKEWRRLCLQLDEVVICVSVCAQNEIAPWQRRGSSLRSVNSQSSRSSRGPEARRISDLASQDFSARRKSADGGAGRRYVRHVSAPEELMRALHAETHSVRVLSLRSEWFKRGVLLRYYNTSGTAKCPQLAEFYERLCRFWTSKLDVWYATSAQIPLLTHRAAVMRKIVYYALCASDPLSCIRRTLLSPKTLAAMAAQITWYDAMSAMAEDFARALDFLQQGHDSRFTEEDAKECAAKLAFARERISANVDEISANPDCVTELL